MMADAAAVKACCAAAYGSPAARWLLGERLRPGGEPLTAQLLGQLGARPGARLADVACGSGASAIQAATDTGCEVIGLDLSPANVRLARAAAARAGLGGRARFEVADAEALPLEDASVDGVLCECALCTFPDTERAMREMARILRPGGRLALSDMTADPKRLPRELRSLDAWIACIANARPLDELGALLAGAGLVVEHRARHDAALEALIDRAQARLRLARALDASIPAELVGSIERALEIAAAARRALSGGALGYATVIAHRP
jgi:arsenite methyltransferase